MHSLKKLKRNSVNKKKEGLKRVADNSIDHESIKSNNKLSKNKIRKLKKMKNNVYSSSEGQAVNKKHLNDIIGSENFNNGEKNNLVYENKLLNCTSDKSTDISTDTMGIPFCFKGRDTFKICGGKESSGYKDFTLDMIKNIEGPLGKGFVLFIYEKRAPFNSLRDTCRIFNKQCSTQKEENNGIITVTSFVKNKEIGRSTAENGLKAETYSSIDAFNNLMKTYFAVKVKSKVGTRIACSAGNNNMHFEDNNSKAQSMERKIYVGLKKGLKLKMLSPILKNRKFDIPLDEDDQGTISPVKPLGQTDQQMNNSVNTSTAVVSSKKRRERQIPLKDLKLELKQLIRNRKVKSFVKFISNESATEIGRYKKMMLDFFLSDSFDDLIFSIKLESEMHNELENFAKTLKLSTQVCGNQNNPCFVVSKILNKHNIWIIMEQLLNSNSSASQKYELFYPGSVLLKINN